MFLFLNKRAQYFLKKRDDLDAFRVNSIALDSLGAIFGYLPGDTFEERYTYAVNNSGLCAYKNKHAEVAALMEGNTFIRLDNFSAVMYLAAKKLLDLARIPPKTFESILLGHSFSILEYAPTLIVAKSAMGLMTIDFKARWSRENISVTHIPNAFYPVYSGESTPTFIVFNCHPDNGDLFVRKHFEEIVAWAKKHGLATSTSAWLLPHGVVKPMVYWHCGYESGENIPGRRVVKQTDHCRIEFASPVRHGNVAIGMSTHFFLPDFHDRGGAITELKVKTFWVHPQFVKLAVSIINAIRGLTTYERDPRPITDKSALGRGLWEYEPLFSWDLGAPRELLVLAVAANLYLKSGTALPIATCTFLKALPMDHSVYFKNIYFVCWHVIAHSGLGRAIFSMVESYARYGVGKLHHPLCQGKDDVELGILPNECVVEPSKQQEVFPHLYPMPIYVTMPVSDSDIINDLFGTREAGFVFTNLDKQPSILPEFRLGGSAASSNSTGVLESIKHLLKLDCPRSFKMWLTRLNDMLYDQLPWDEGYTWNAIRLLINFFGGSQQYRSRVTPFLGINVDTTALAREISETGSSSAFSRDTSTGMAQIARERANAGDTESVLLMKCANL